MADKRCENGHFIDESWDLCPYCPAEAGEPDVPIVRPSRFGGSQDARLAPAPAPPPEQPRRAAPAAPPPAIVPRHDTAPVQPPPMERTVAASKLTTETPLKRY